MESESAPRETNEMTASVDSVVSVDASASAGEVEVSKESVQIGTITAQKVTVSNSAVGNIKGESVTASMENGVIGAVVASHVDVTVTNGALGAVVAQDVNIKDSNVNILIAGQVTGNSRILFDMRAGLVAGVVAGLIMVAFKLMRGRRAR